MGRFNKPTQLPIMFIIKLTAVQAQTPSTMTQGSFLSTMTNETNTLKYADDHQILQIAGKVALIQAA